MLTTILLIAGLILILLAAFNIAARRVSFGWLGLALIVLAVWVLPAVGAHV